MPETITPERSAMLLSDLSRFIGGKWPAWPEEFLLDDLAALIAKGRAGERKADYRQWQIRINDAIDAGRLTTRILDLPAVPAGRRITGGGGISRHSMSWVPEKPGRRLYFIPCAPAAQWLALISFDFDAHEHVCAWLGDARQSEAQAAVHAVPAATPAPAQTIKERRIAAIVETACRLEYEPQNIAWGGKAAIKVECLKDAKLFTDSTFDSGWKAAVKAGKIKVENSETYTKR